MIEKIFLIFLMFFALSYSYTPACIVTRRLCEITGYSVGGKIPNRDDYSRIIETVDILNSYLKKNQKIKLIGCNDSIEVKNKEKLSFKRARELFQLLRFYGLREDIKVKLLGMGDEKYRNRNDTREGRCLNRRVEIIF